VTVSFPSVESAKVSCTCPAHRRSKYCKHVVALCTALLEQPAAFAVLDVLPEPLEPRVTTAITPVPKNVPKGPTFNDSKPPATLVVADRKRTVGLNYVIVQSYPDPKDAEEAKQLLLKNDVLCSVEPTPSNWADPKWKMVSVIGITGFDKIHSAEFEQYINKIQKISDGMAGKPKFKRFEPKAYKWRDAKLTQ